MNKQGREDIERFCRDCLTLHEYYQSNYYSWYHIEILIDSLTDVLAGGVGFQPREPIDEPAYCITL